MIKNKKRKIAKTRRTDFTRQGVGRRPKQVLVKKPGNNENTAKRRNKMTARQPGYLRLAESGELERRVTLLKEKQKSCVLCPHHCRVNRFANERGFCRAGARAVVSSYGPHFGEE